MIVSMPLYVDIGKKRGTDKPRRFYFNLNNYRNWHFQVCNKVKAAYKEIMTPKVLGLTVKRAGLHFMLHRGDKRKVDRANILSIHEKFFCDALVELGCMVDDDDSRIEYTHYTTGQIDRENPRVDICIVQE